jgi:hypothetical protein
LLKTKTVFVRSFSEVGPWNVPKMVGSIQFSHFFGDSWVSTG